jgi:hypothetical protein
LQDLGLWEPTCPYGACSPQPQGQRVAWHHIGLCSFHESSLPGYVRELCVPTDSSWSWWPRFPTRWCTSPFWCHCTHCSGWTVSWSMDLQRRTDELAPTKDIVNSERVESSSDLCPRITMAVTAVSVDMLSWLWGEVEFRFDVCRAISGAHTVLH